MRKFEETVHKSSKLQVCLERGKVVLNPPFLKENHF